jgi:hypothetical protein
MRRSSAAAAGGSGFAPAELAAVFLLPARAPSEIVGVRLLVGGLLALELLLQAPKAGAARTWVAQRG